MQSLCWTSDRAAIGRGSAPPPQHHPPVVPALAYRFDGPDRSIVVSGDTDTSGTLVQLARGADGLALRRCTCRRSIGRSGRISRARSSSRVTAWRSEARLLGEPPE
jgi:hypothetical protein